jgi:hypothetical protein
MKRVFLKNLILFALWTTAFTMGFHRNYWRIVDQAEFKKFDLFCQSQVIGRVLKSEKDGIFSDAGLTGWIRNDSMMKTWNEMTIAQFELYRQKTDLKTYSFVIYDSQVGGQGIMFAFLDKLSPLSNKDNLNVFWLLTSFSLAILMSSFVFWVNLNYGFYPSLITFFLLLISPWLVFFGRNLYFVLSSFYFPFILMLLIMYYESLNIKNISLGSLYLLSLAAVFLKLFFSGFEYITTALIMFTIPIFYYSILDKWKFRLFFKRLCYIALGSISSIIVYILLFAYQLSTLKGSFLFGFKNLLYAFLKRTYGNSAQFPDGFKASLESSIIEVLKLYFKDNAISTDILTITFKTLIYILIIFSIMIFIPRRISISTYENRRKNLTLVFTTWTAILAPLSWFVIFKAHSFIHYSYNYIVWYMPFCLFGFALIGSVLSSIIKDICSYFAKPDYPILKFE